MKSLEVISIKRAAFRINGNSCRCIQANILFDQFVRKLFSGDKIVCFSRNGLYSTARKSCMDCEKTLCGSWIRLFLKIDENYYVLELPRELMSVYTHFLYKVKTNGLAKRFNLPATLSLNLTKKGVLFSLCTYGLIAMKYFENRSNQDCFNHRIF